MTKVELTDFRGNPLIIQGAEGTPIDNIVAKLYVTSELLFPNKSTNEISPLTIAKNKVACEYKFISNDLQFTDKGTIEYQGNTTLYDPKKGFRFSFDKKHRFKDFIAMKKFNGKAYYGDWMHVFEPMGNDLLEQMYQSRKQGEIRPYMLNNDFASDKLECLMDVGAICHIDGLPMELYINDVYWGLYSMNYKKDEDLYCIDKKNYNHIQVEAGTAGTTVATFNDSSFAEGGSGWGLVEFRDPSKLITTSLAEYDGDAPSELIGTSSANYDAGNSDHVNTARVKTAWQNLIHNLNALTSSSTEEDCAEFLNVIDWVDNLLLSDFVCNLDNWAKNTLYTTWDGGQHWSPLVYDLNNTWGVHWVSGIEKNLAYNQDPIAYVYAGYLPWMNNLKKALGSRLSLRYAELREKGIFSLDNVQKMLNDRTNEIGKDAYERDIERWTYAGGIDYYDSVKLLRWVEKRIEWLDQRYGFVD